MNNRHKILETHQHPVPLAIFPPFLTLSPLLDFSLYVSPHFPDAQGQYLPETWGRVEWVTAFQSLLNQNMTPVMLARRQEKILGTYDLLTRHLLPHELLQTNPE